MLTRKKHKPSCKRARVAAEDRKVAGFAYGYFKDVPDEVLSRWGASEVGYNALMAVDQDY